MHNIEESKNQKQSLVIQECRIQIHSKGLGTKKRRVKTWSTAQDEQLVRLYKEYPKKWPIIASLMNDRNQNQCLHRYRRLCLLGVRQKVWSSHEDQTILELVKKVGKNWKIVSEILGTKTGKQIRERYINKLDPKIKTQDWTKQQDQLILKYYSQMGRKWSQISKKLPGRPQNKIKNRFYSYIQKNYRIKFIPVDSIHKMQLKQIINNQAGGIQNKRQSLKQMEMNEKGRIGKQQKLDKKRKKMQISSIKQIEAQEQMQDQSQNNSCKNQNQNKYGLQSLIKVDQQFPHVDESRYRSIRSLNSNNQIENQNDLFYSLHI